MELFIEKNSKLHPINPTLTTFVQRELGNSLSPIKLTVGDNVTAELLLPEWGKSHERYLKVSTYHGGFQVLLQAALEQTGEQVLADCFYLKTDSCSKGVVSNGFDALVPGSRFTLGEMFHNQGDNLYLQVTKVQPVY